jgi:hypothetical protein
LKYQSYQTGRRRSGADNASSAQLHFRDFHYLPFFPRENRDNTIWSRCAGDSSVVGILRPSISIGLTHLRSRCCIWLLLYTHRHQSMLGAAGHIILTPANQLMVKGLKIWSLSNPCSNQRPFDHLRRHDAPFTNGSKTRGGRKSL